MAAPLLIPLLVRAVLPLMGRAVASTAARGAASQVARAAATRTAAASVARSAITRGAGTNAARVLAGSTAARTAATAGARGSLLGRAAIGYAGFDVLGDVLKSFFSGAKEGITGGFLGGDGDNGGAGGRGGSSSLSSSTSLAGAGAGGNFSEANKENCCCCKETLSLLSSIDSTLKIGLRVSKAQLELEASRNASEKETMAESKKQDIAGKGGFAENLQDTAEQTGFDIGRFILNGIGGLFATNIPQFFQGRGNKLVEQQQKEGINPGYDVRLNVGGAMASGGLVIGPGGPREDKVTRNLSNGEFVVNADSTRANISLLSQINNNPFSMLAQKQKEAEQQGQIIGNIVAASLEKSFRKENILGASQKQIIYIPSKPLEDKKTQTSTSKSPTNTLGNMLRSMTGTSSSSLADFIGKYESNNDPNVYRKGGEAIRGEDLSKLNIEQILSKEGTAFGKFQFTPETLGMLVSEMKDLNMISGKERFDESTQNKIFEYQLSKIPSIERARSGNQRDIDAAMIDLAKIWRALPDPRTGMTYGDQYSKYNKAGVSVAEFRNQFTSFLENQKTSPLDSIMDIFKKPGQILDQIALTREANMNKQMAAAAAPVFINNQSGGQQSKMPSVMLPIDGPTLPSNIVSAISQFMHRSV